MWLQRFKKNFTHVLNYVPGLVILVFGMLALYSSLQLIDAYERLEIFYLSQSPSASFDYDQVQVIHDEKKVREVWLYWSVIAIGLSGFVLVVLNSHKLLQLQVINQEKKEYLNLLENRLAAMESSFDGIGIVDRNGNLTYMNKALRRLCGAEEGSTDFLVGQSWKFLFAEEGRKDIEKNIMPELERSGYWHGESSIAHQGGDTVYAELSLTRLADGGFIGTVRNITDKKEADQEKEELQSQFYQAQKMEAIGRLAGGIAHDFNNILAAMNGYAEFLVDDLEEDTPQHGFAQSILQAGQQARELVDQMLAFSRRKEESKQRFDLMQPVLESISMLSASLPKTIEVHTDIDLENAFMSGNSTQISQVVMNLCVNAKDAMDEKHGVLKINMRAIDVNEYEALGMVVDVLPENNEMPTIRIEDLEPGQTRLALGSMARNHKYVRLSVSDTGCGISRVIMEHIFEPFFTTKPVDKGTGLGLSTVHGVVAEHGGAMIVDSKIDSGTLFELFFPVLEVDVIEDVEVSQDVLSHAGAKILLVEDQDNVQQMMVAMLERLGHEAISCSSGLEALDILREGQHDFDLVLTDQNMPKMTGLELVMQANYDFPDLPFVLLSGYSQKKLQGLMKEHPAIKAVLRKPVSSQSLAKQINAVIAGHKTKKQVA